LNWIKLEGPDFGLVVAAYAGMRYSAQSTPNGDVTTGYYFCSGIDALVIGNFVLAKAGLSQFQANPKTVSLRTPIPV